MKKVVLTIMAALFIIVGCQENNSPLEPTNDSIDASVLNKGRVILDRNLDDDDDLRLLDDFSDETNYKVKYTDNFTVDGKKGARLSIKHSWKDEFGSPISLTAELIIPRNAFEGVENFDMIFDLENFSMELYPSPFEFDIPVEFSMYFYGLDLSEYVGYDLDFNYLDGEEEELEYYHKDVDFNNGNLVVWGAKLHHFSRYGWVRTK